MKSRGNRRRTCRCKHAGNCPNNSNLGEALALTYPDGTKIFRALRSDETSRALISAEVNGVIHEVNKPEDGDRLAMSPDGFMVVDLRPIDVDRCRAYTAAREGLICRLKAPAWRAANPVPAEHMFVDVGQEGSRGVDMVWEAVPDGA